MADEIKRQTKLLNLDFEGFLEAICRLTCFKPMPSTDELIIENVVTAADFFARRKFEGRYQKWLDKNKLEYNTEEGGGRSLSETVEMLLSLFVEKFDTDGSGMVTTKDWAAKGSPQNKRRGSFSLPASEWVQRPGRP